MPHFTNLWEGEFGDDYHARNQPTEENLRARKKLFSKIFTTRTFPYKILEVGAGVGTNLIALMAMGNRDLYAIEPNLSACRQLEQEPLKLDKNHMLPADPAASWNGTFDLVFTSGVLIHIKSPELLHTMEMIYRLSKKYILCIEYFNPTEIMVPYRGQQNALWKRDYGALWLDNFPLEGIAYGFEWKRETELDNLTWWLFKKV